MTLGEKLASLRKKQAYTQEQFADLLGVSRQSVSKWESDLSYPETDKLIRISQLYQCSLDYLLKDDITDLSEFPSPVAPYHMTSSSETTSEEPSTSGTLHFHYKFRTPIDKKSHRSLFGMPLWHVNTNPKQVAKGILAVGFRAQGIVSVGILSAGLFSFGLLSLGLFSLALFSIGALAIGSFALGLLAIGAISIGVISIGALSVGCFSIGALALGKYFAIGDSAHAMIALGKTTANGSLFESLQPLSDLSRQDMAHIKNLLDESVPNYLGWANRLIQLLLNL